MVFKIYIKCNNKDKHYQHSWLTATKIEIKLCTMIG